MASVGRFFRADRPEILPNRSSRNRQPAGRVKPPVHNPQLARFLARQDGVITLDQLRQCGVSGDAVQRRVDSKAWRRCGPSVYRDATHAWSHSAKLRAAVLSAGEGAAAHGVSAAWWHGLTEKPSSQQFVTIPRTRCLVRTVGTRVRSRDLAKRDLKTVRGLLVTAVPLTVLEASINDSLLMDRALQTRVTLPILQNAHDRNAGRAGAKQAARLLKSAGEGGRSEAERMLHRILRAEKITGWRGQYTACGFDLDAAFISERIGLEVDGWRWHRDALRNSEDLKRQNILVNAGWHILRFDWHRLKIDSRGVVADVRAALDPQR